MDFQDNKFNYKIVFAALVAVIVGILIAFYYSYAQSQTQIGYLEKERSLLVKDLTLMRAEVDRLSALNEVNEIELSDSRERVQQLLDSVGRLNFNIAKLREYRAELRKMEARYDSLKLRNNNLQYNNTMLADKYEETRKMLDELRGRSNTLAEVEAQLREKNRELSRELRRKSYLQLNSPEGSGFRMRSGRPIRTNKASTIEKLRGCVTVAGNPNANAEEKVIYLQFLGPDMRVIEDNANILSVNGNVYSKKVELLFMGDELNVCDFISVPEGTLIAGIYTLNVFEDERLLATTEFELK
jgi:TolA-binding protein